MTTENDAAKCQRVAERIGVWKPDAESTEIDAAKQAELKAKFNMYLRAPIPDLSSPAMVVAMLEWLLAHSNCIDKIYGPQYHSYQVKVEYESVGGTMCETGKGKSLSEALIDAIDMLPEG